jgi:hypothetical protein
MQEHQSIEAMLQDMINCKYCTKDRARFKLPIAYFLLGDYGEARRELREGMAQIGSQQDAYSEQYRRLSEGLLKKMNSAERSP